MLRLADSIRSLSKEDISRVIAAYLLFKSRGRSSRDLVTFLATNEFWRSVGIGLRVFPPLVIGMVGDSEFRALVFSALATSGRESQRKRSGPKQVALGH